MENPSNKLQSSKEIIAYLTQCFPLCFIADGDVKPVKIGIFKDLVERLPVDSNISKTQLRAALRLYTSSWRYLYSLKEGIKRIDLDGNNCGELTAEHIEYAKQKIKDAKLRVKARSMDKNVKNHQHNTENTHENKKGKKPFHKKTSLKSAPDNKFSTPFSEKTSNKELKSEYKKQQDKTKLTLSPIKNVGQLQVNQRVKIRVGRDIADGTVLAIVKDGVKIQLNTGLSLIVRVEHVYES